LGLWDSLDFELTKPRAPYMFQNDLRTEDENCDPKRRKTRLTSDELLKRSKAYSWTAQERYIVSLCKVEEHV
jgi:hypothetical protein